MKPTKIRTLQIKLTEPEYKWLKQKKGKKPWNQFLFDIAGDK